jgi:hypothetical protein
VAETFARMRVPVLEATFVVSLSHDVREIGMTYWSEKAGAEQKAGGPNRIRCLTSWNGKPYRKWSTSQGSMGRLPAYPVGRG